MLSLLEFNKEAKPIIFVEVSFKLPDFNLLKKSEVTDLEVTSSIKLFFILSSE